jgi:hypothetical protein
MTRCRIEIDDDALCRQIEQLPTDVLQTLLKELHGEGSRMLFDIFVSELVPAGAAGGTQKVVIGFRLRGSDERLIAAA